MSEGAKRLESIWRMEGENMSVILDMAKLPGVGKTPWPERAAEIDRRCALLYQEREKSRLPVTPSHIAAVLGLHPSDLAHYKNGSGGRLTHGGPLIQEYYPTVKETINAWITRFDALTQDIMSTTDTYQPAMYLLKSLYGHSDRPDANKETVTVSFELIRGELDKIKAELPAGVFPQLACGFVKNPREPIYEEGVSAGKALDISCDEARENTIGLVDTSLHG